MKITRRQLRQLISEAISQTREADTTEFLKGDDDTHRPGERRTAAPITQSGPGPGEWEDVDWPGMPEWEGDPFSDIDVELDDSGNWVSRS